MNLFSGLEKFGLKADEEMNLFEDESKKGDEKRRSRKTTL